MGVNPKKVVLIAFLFSTAYKLCTFRGGAIYRAINCAATISVRYDFTAK